MNWHDWLNRLAWARRRHTAPGNVVTLEAMQRGLGKPVVLSPAQQLDADQRLAELRRQYPALDHWPANLPEMIRRESLAALSLLNSVLPDRLASDLPTLRWLDVGSKNGAVAFGIATHASALTHTALVLDLVELDAGRRYRGGLRRIDHGTTLAHVVATWLGKEHAVNYRATDVRALTQHYDVITWFLPFLFAGPHQSWGLPLSLLAPTEVLRHVLERLNPEGRLVIVNHTPAEADEQQRLLAGCENAEIIDHRLGQDPWCHPGKPRQITLVRRLSRPA